MIEANKKIDGRTNAKLTDKNRLASTNPGLMLEWDITKNCSLTPYDVSFGSKRKVWWICSNCKYSWKASIHHRTDKNRSTGCPACANKTPGTRKSDRPVRICTFCHTEKTRREFYKRSSRCKECIDQKNKKYYQQNTTKVNEKRQRWADDNKEKVKETLKNWYYRNKEHTKEHRRETKLKKWYKMTLIDYEKKLNSQKRACYICGVKHTDKNKLHVDHDHACCLSSISCGMCVRGLLCCNCNHLLGCAHDCIQTLQNAIDYLNQWKEQTEQDKRS